MLGKGAEGECGCSTGPKKVPTEALRQLERAIVQNRYLTPVNAPELLDRLTRLQRDDPPEIEIASQSRASCGTAERARRPPGSFVDLCAFPWRVQSGLSERYYAEPTSDGSPAIDTIRLAPTRVEPNRGCFPEFDPFMQPVSPQPTPGGELAAVFGPECVDRTGKWPVATLLPPCRHPEAEKPSSRYFSHSVFQPPPRKGGSSYMVGNCDCDCYTFTGGGRTYKPKEKSDPVQPENSGQKGGHTIALPQTAAEGLAGTASFPDGEAPPSRIQPLDESRDSPRSLDAGAETAARNAAVLGLSLSAPVAALRTNVAPSHPVVSASVTDRHEAPTGQVAVRGPLEGTLTNVVQRVRGSPPVGAQTRRGDAARGSADASYVQPSDHGQHVGLVADPGKSRGLAHKVASAPQINNGLNTPGGDSPQVSPLGDASKLEHGTDLDLRTEVGAGLGGAADREIAQTAGLGTGRAVGRGRSLGYLAAAATQASPPAPKEPDHSAEQEVPDSHPVVPQDSGSGGEEPGAEDDTGRGQGHPAGDQGDGGDGGDDDGANGGGNGPGGGGGGPGGGGGGRPDPKPRPHGSGGAISPHGPSLAGMFGPPVTPDAQPQSGLAPPGLEPPPVDAASRPAPDPDEVPPASAALPYAPDTGLAIPPDAAVASSGASDPLDPGAERRRLEAEARARRRELGGSPPARSPFSSRADSGRREAPRTDAISLGSSLSGRDPATRLKGTTDLPEIRARRAAEADAGDDDALRERFEGRDPLQPDAVGRGAQRHQRISELRGSGAPPFRLGISLPRERLPSSSGLADTATMGTAYPGTPSRRPRTTSDAPVKSPPPVPTAPASEHRPETQNTLVRAPMDSSSPGYVDSQGSGSGGAVDGPQVPDAASRVAGVYVAGGVAQRVDQVGPVGIGRERLAAARALPPQATFQVQMSNGVSMQLGRGGRPDPAQSVASARLGRIYAGYDAREAESAYDAASRAQAQARAEYDAAMAADRDSRRARAASRALIESQQTLREREDALKRATSAENTAIQGYESALDDANGLANGDEVIATGIDIADSITSDGRRNQRARDRWEREARARARAQQRRDLKGQFWNDHREARQEDLARERRRRERRNQGYTLRHQLDQDHYEDWTELAGELDYMDAHGASLDAEIANLDAAIAAANARGDDTSNLENQRNVLVQEREHLDHEIEEREAQARWEAHNGAWPLSELDCDDPRYAKCIPDCDEKETCVCKDPEGDDSPPPGSPGKKRDKEGKGDEQPEDGRTAPSGSRRDGDESAVGPSDGSESAGDHGSRDDEQSSGDSEGSQGAGRGGFLGPKRPPDSTKTIAPPKKKRTGSTEGDGEDSRPKRPEGGGFRDDGRNYFIRPQKPGEPPEQFGIRWAKGADPCKKGSVTYVIIEELYSNGKTGKLAASASPAARKALKEILDRLCKAKRKSRGAGASGSDNAPSDSAGSEATEAGDDQGFDAIQIDDILNPETGRVPLNPIDTDMKDAAIELARHLKAIVESAGLGAAVRAAGELLADPSAIEVVELFYRDELSPTEAVIALVVLDAPVIGAAMTPGSAAELAKGSFGKFVGEMAQVGGTGLAVAMIAGVIYSRNPRRLGKPTAKDIRAINNHAESSFRNAVENSRELAALTEAELDAVRKKWISAVKRRFKKSARAAEGHLNRAIDIKDIETAVDFEFQNMGQRVARELGITYAELVGNSPLHGAARSARMAWKSAIDDMKRISGKRVHTMTSGQDAQDKVLKQLSRQLNEAIPGTDWGTVRKKGWRQRFEFDHFASKELRKHGTSMPSALGAAGKKPKVKAGSGVLVPSAAHHQESGKYRGEGKIPNFAVSRGQRGAFIRAERDAGAELRKLADELRSIIRRAAR